MTSHPDLSDAQRVEIAKWILSQTGSATEQVQATTYAHTLKDGTTVQLDFPLFIDLPVAITLLVIALVSGALSLGVLKKSQPADLLR